jgi:hypothetical protein
MMSHLFNAMNDQNRSTTTNGMAQLRESGSVLTDLFFQIGAARGQFDSLIEPLLKRALATDTDLAVRILLWVRDVRGGAGDRQIFRDALKSLVIGNQVSDSDLTRIARKVPELGRWDDLLVLFGTRGQDSALSLIAAGLRSEDRLCAKWMPREKSSRKKEAYVIRKFLGLDRASYRKMLSRLSDTVEDKMCAGEWTDINFSHVPSRAISIYRRAFERQAPSEYRAWVARLEDKNDDGVKINASATFPHDVLKDAANGSVAAVAQWDALPDYLEGTDERILPIVDVSGSMSWCTIDDSGSTRPIDVAVALGLYMSERNESVFKNKFITFSDRPTLQTLSGSLMDRCRQMNQSAWRGTTDLEAAFDLILKSAVKHNVDASEMPTQILILSDMQFNNCVRGAHKTAFEMIRDMYESAGYKMPNVVFWNLMSSGGSPVSFDETGTALVSGYSPSIVKSVMGGQDLTPVGMMLNAIGAEKYNWR